MAAEGSLKRLGGGRWETKDGRFAIEPQSGTWVVVDNTQTDDLGLPLVRGPFGSLTAAKEAIERARETGPAESPLADRIKRAGAEPRARAGAGAQKADRGTSSGKSVTGGWAAGLRSSAAAEKAEPAPPSEPRWLSDMTPGDRRKARELIERLSELGLEDAETVARAEIARDEPAITRLALERTIAAAIKSARSPAGAGRAVVKAIMGGRDPDLGARWRLVDERGRRIDALEIPD